MTVFTETRRAPVIDGYDLEKEKGRYAFPDAIVGPHRLNRGTATVRITGDMRAERLAAAMEAHRRHLYTTTHDDGAPVLELGYPVAGSYVMCSAGVYMDMMLGCAQKLLDENHPAFTASLEAMRRHGLLFRREINSDDYLCLANGVEGVHTPQDLAALAGKIAGRAFPVEGGYRTFFSSSGTEAIEAAIKLALVVKYKKFVAAYGHETLAKVAAALSIARNHGLDGPGRDPVPLYRDYPFFLFALEGAFHGRTLGALALTQSKKAHQYGYPKSRWVRHLEFNGDPAELERIIDPRRIDEILAAPGGVAQVIGEGRVPADLAAGLVAEGFQGEGGYRPGDPGVFAGIERTCRRHDVLIVADEVQSFGRTGRFFFFEHLGVRPDVIAMAKSAVVGITVAAARLEEHLHGGWHSNTWGGGRIFETNLAYATFDALAHHADPLFLGRSYLENCELKGAYLLELLGGLAARHPRTLVSVSGYGLMVGATVARRDELVKLAWERGLKLLGCGAGGELSRLRILFLADTITREIEDFVETFDAILTELEARP